MGQLGADLAGHQPHRARSSSTTWNQARELAPRAENAAEGPEKQPSPLEEWETARCGILAGMPRPRTEREAWEQERAEIPAQIAAWHEMLAAIPATDPDRREMLTWTIRRAERRLAALDAHRPDRDP